MAVFYHIAVGRFGAQCLGKLYWLVREEELDDPSSHRFFWFGQGPRPDPNTAAVDRTVPVWDFPEPRFQLPTAGPWKPGQGLEQDRSALAQAVAASLADTRAKEGLGATLRMLLREYPIELFGRGQNRPVHLTLCGSLADPADSALMLGWLRALEELREGGTITPTVHVVAGIGEESAELPEAEDIRRAMAARALYDLQSYLSAGHPARRMASVYLVGEKPMDTGIPAERDEQVALAAYTLLALTKDINSPEAERPRESNWPFSVAVVDDEVFWGGNAESLQKYDAQKPFAVIGGYAVMTPAGRLANLLAARFCRDFFRHLSLQPSLGAPDGPYQAFFASLVRSEEPASGTGIEPPRDGFPSPGQLAYLRQLVNRAAGATWDALGAEAQAASQAAHRGWPAWRQLEQLVGKASDDPVWKRLMGIYGDDRFLKIPLEDWDQAFAEFETLIESGFFSRRRLRFQHLQQALPLAVQSGFERVAGELFAVGCLREELRLEPHRLAQALLGMCYAHLRAAHDDLEKERLQLALPDRYQDLHRHLKAQKERILAAIAEVPSPVAVICRAGLILCACIGLLLAMPLPARMDWVTAWMRIGTGAALGGAGVLGIWLRTLSYKSFLLQRVGEWFSQFTLYVEARDDAERQKAVEEALARSLRHLRWMFDGASPLPAAETGCAGADMEPASRESIWKIGTPGQPDSTPKQSLQSVLSGYRAELESIAKRFDALEGDLLKTFQASRLETYLPKVGPRELKPLELEYAAMMGTADRLSAQHYLACLRQLEHDLRAEKRPEDPATAEDCLPFALLAGSKGRDVPCWRDGWTAGADWRSTVTRSDEKSLPLRFHRLLAQRYLLPRIREKTLARRLETCADEIEPIKAQLQAVGASSDIGGKDSGREDMRMLMESEANDPLVMALHEGARPGNSLGLKRLTLLIKALMRVAARDVVFYPNPDNPTNPLGLAWRKHEHSRLGPAFLPCNVVPPAQGQAEWEGERRAA